MTRGRGAGGTRPGVLVRNDDADAHRCPGRGEEGDAGQVAQAAAGLLSARAGIRIVVG
jgi:hypothetical protein